jgi:hypothetical protein
LASSAPPKDMPAHCDEQAGSAPMPDAQYWRDRAEEVRASAEAMHDPVARQTLLKIAEEYERLAERAARRAH